MGTKACDPCHSIGTQEVDTKLTISVPAGIGNNSTMRLKAAGNYMGQSIFGDAATDVFVNVSVNPEEGLVLEGSNVVSHLRLSLLEALVGSQKNVKTIHNTILVIIPPGTKNKEEIDLPGMGVVSANGKQRVILDIDYPDDKDSLIEFLKSKEN
jgi:molecular chaperone DnaJ